MEEVAEGGSCWSLWVGLGIATQCCACHRRLEAAGSVATLSMQTALVFLCSNQKIKRAA